MPDVLIIGAGPAGCAAAVVLARRGWAVTLVEQHRFPRDKVCGECLSALGVDVLGRLGLVDAFQEAGAVRFDRTTLFAPDGGSIAVDLPRPMWGLSRGTFDLMLLDAARAAGAVVRQPARCEDVAVSPSGVHVRVRDLVSNQVDVLSPSFVLLADGKRALGGGAPPHTGDFGIKAHFVNVDGPRDAIELFAAGGRYGGLAAIEGGRWNAAFSVSGDQLRSIVSDVSAMFDRIVAGNRALARRLRRAERVGGWLAAPLPRFGPSWDEAMPPNVIQVGNAAAAVEPIGGEGMGLALRSGELAAKALAARRGAWTSNDRERLESDYRRLWQTRRFACRAAALAVTSRWFGALAGASGAEPPGLQVAMGLMGKQN